MIGTIYIKAMGCKVSQAEASSIAQEAFDRGLTPISNPDNADVIVLNTCTVTSRSDADTRQTLRRFHSINPNAAIIIAGCLPRIENEIRAEFQPYCIPVSSPDCNQILDAAVESASRLNAKPLSTGSGREINGFGKLFINKNRSRPFLKIQDGCDSSCSYCIVPLARGPSISVPEEIVIERLKNYLSAGYKEVVLVGIHLGLYGRDLHQKSSILKLLGRISDVISPCDGARIRLTSIEPFEADDDLIDYIAANPFICRHLHLPLQSGSNRILAMMNRPYTSEQYMDRLERIKKYMPDACVGTDIISGFPGETDFDHRETANLIKDSRLDYLHVFTFSPRPHTKAFSLPERPASTVVSRRVSELRNLGKIKRIEFNRSMINKTFTAIHENSDNGHGYTFMTDNYIKATVEDTVIETENLHKIRITGVHESGMVTASLVHAGGSNG